MKRMQRILSLLLVLALTAAAAMTLGSCGKKDPTPADTVTTAAADKQTINVTLIVVGKDGEKTTYQIETAAKNLRAAFADAEGLTVEGDETEYGLYIKKVNGLRGDYNEDGYFWSLCDKDGNMTPNGADSTEIADGDVYQLIYTKA